MPKQIFPSELAEIVTALLVKPEMYNELDTPEKHQAFFHAIGNVVADHCGGQINLVNDPVCQEADYLSDQYTMPTLSVSPNENLPSLDQNVWAYHDHQGWEDLTGDNNHIPSSENMKASDQAYRQSIQSSFCSKLQSLLANKGLAEGITQVFTFPLKDWRVASQVPLEHPDDDLLYKAVCHLGNQSTFEVMNSDGDPCFGAVVEIDKGVPAIHVDAGADAFLHIHLTPEGFIVTADDDKQRIQYATPSRHTYQGSRSLLFAFSTD